MKNKKITKSRIAAGGTAQPAIVKYPVRWVFAGVLVLLLVPALIPSPVLGGDEVSEDESGIYLGIRFNGSSLHTDSEGDELFIKDDGGGVALDGGYRFNRSFSLELSISGANHDTSAESISAVISSVTISGYYRFSPGSAFRPYLKGGMGGYALRLEEASVTGTIEGGGVCMGGGFRFFFTPHFALGVDLTLNIIEYDQAQLHLGEFSLGSDIDEEGSYTTLGISFLYGF